MHQGIEESTIFIADCLDVMKSWPAGSFKFIYADPPFFSQRNYRGRENSGAEGLGFDDVWGKDIPGMQRLLDHLRCDSRRIACFIESIVDKGLQHYLLYLHTRLREMKRLLHPDGSIFIHSDPTAGHYVKVLLDHEGNR